MEDEVTITGILIDLEKDQLLEGYDGVETSLRRADVDHNELATALIEHRLPMYLSRIEGAAGVGAALIGALGEIFVAGVLYERERVKLGGGA